MQEQFANPLGESACGRQVVTIQWLLEWAFGVEYASLDFDEINDDRPAVGHEYGIIQQLMLGVEPGQGVKPDTSFGRSLPHDDAEIVSTFLRHSVEFYQAKKVAEYARNFTKPRWDLGPQKILPRNWGKKNHLGVHGKPEVCRIVEYTVRGRKRQRKDLWVPCAWVPTASQIAAARREYLDWYGALLEVLSAMQAIELSKFILCDKLPPMTPWKKTS